MKNLNNNWLWIIFLATSVQVSQSQAMGENADDELSMFEAINRAKDNDPWLTASEFKQAKLNAMAVSAGQLADPVISLGLANLAADSFNFNQEPMTHLKVAVSQMFSRGQTKKLKSEQISLLADEQPLLRENRLAQLTSEVGHLWLDTYKAQESIRLIESDRSLFEQLVDLVEASYSAGFGQARQQDLIRAQLELTRLEDRLNQLNQAQESSLVKLNGLISQDYLILSTGSLQGENKQAVKLTIELPKISLITANDSNQSLDNSKSQALALLLKHPTVLALDQQIQAENKGIDLAQQKYKPAWGINASYGYRDNAENGISRADLFSVGITFDLPLFTKNRQDQDLKSAVSSVDSLEMQKLLLLRQLMTSYDEELAKLKNLEQRNQLYKENLLPQMNQQVQSSLTAYTHDDGDFTEVIRAKIAELNAQIDSLEIVVNIAKTKLKLNYLLAGGQTQNIEFNDISEHHHE